MADYTLEYTDHRPIWIPKLKYHKGGVHLPGKNTNQIKVTEKERHYLMKMKNGKRPCFKEVVERSYRRQNTDGGTE